MKLQRSPTHQAQTSAFNDTDGIPTSSGAVAKAAQAVGSKVKLQRGLEEEEAEDEEEADQLERRRQWGANKKTYHGADEVVSKYRTSGMAVVFEGFGRSGTAAAVVRQQENVPRPRRSGEHL